MASSFGPDGPYRDRVGFDGGRAGDERGDEFDRLPEAPVRSIVPWADYGNRAACGVWSDGCALPSGTNR